MCNRCFPSEVERRITQDFFDPPTVGGVLLLYLFTYWSIKALNHFAGPFAHYITP